MANKPIATERPSSPSGYRPLTRADIPGTGISDKLLDGMFLRPDGVIVQFEDELPVGQLNDDGTACWFHVSR